MALVGVRYAHRQPTGLASMFLLAIVLKSGTDISFCRLPTKLDFYFGCYDLVGNKENLFG
jgi:hypothetical protein